MTDAEADVEAARLTLVAMTEQPWFDQPPEVIAALDRIFRWLPAPGQRRQSARESPRSGNRPPGEAAGRFYH